MSKHNLITKKLKKQFLSINDSIESYFNNFKLFLINLKKTKITKNNRVFLSSFAVVILTLCYFLIPSVYNKNIIKEEIKNQIKKRYNINLKFNEKISYGLFPKPHFSTKRLSILRGQEKIALANNFKVFISISKFFSINQIDIKDLIFKKTDFNIYNDDTIFFKDLLKTEPNENKIIIRDSNIFFKNNNDEVLFINKIYNSKFYYDSKNLQNVLQSKNQVFNLPYKLIIKNNKFNKSVNIKFNSKKIRLHVENELNYANNQNNGIFDILLVNKGTSFEYEFNDKSLNFSSFGKKNQYEGKMDFKPFYFSAIFNYDGINTKKIFNEESVFINLIKSEILNNKNLNASIKLNVKDITNISELNNLYLIAKIDQGKIDLTDSNMMWKEDLKITLSDCLLSYEDGNLNLNGRLTFNFFDIDNFYRSFQLQKKFRKKIERIDIDFLYDFNQQKISFDNARLDNTTTSNLQNFIDDYNSGKNKIFNKVTFKNFVNNFFRAYVG